MHQNHHALPVFLGKFNKDMTKKNAHAAATSRHPPTPRGPMNAIPSIVFSTKMAFQMVVDLCSLPVKRFSWLLWTSKKE